MLIFLHGLESSGNGAKGRFFAAGYPEMLRPDFTGDLSARLARLRTVAGAAGDLVLVGSSFGGLLATVFALDCPGRVRRLVLLAPALNFPDFAPYAGGSLAVPTHLVIGRDDTVTPASDVAPIARRVFTDLRLDLVADDHLLHRVFPSLDWPSLLDRRRAFA